MLKITKMKKEHIGEIAEIEKICFHDPWSEKMLRSELESDISCYFVAEDDGAVCGYAGMYVTVDVANITNIAVRPEKRRCGIADKLMAALIAEAKAQNLGFVTLEVRMSNAPAVALYEKYSFVKAGKRKGYYSDNHEDALIMTLEFKD